MKKRHTPEQIVGKLHQADVALGQGLKVPAVSKQPGISEQAYYRWRQKYGGMAPAMAKHLKALEKENAFRCPGSSENAVGCPEPTTTAASDTGQRIATTCGVTTF